MRSVYDQMLVKPALTTVSFSVPQMAKVINSFTILCNNLSHVRSGITALLALGILEQIQEQGLAKPLLEMEHNSPEYLHTLIEALR